MGVNVEQLLYGLVRLDHRAAVWGACVCARSVEPWLPTTARAPREALARAEAWVHGQQTAASCASAAEAAYRFNATRLPPDSAERFAANLAAASAAYAAHATTSDPAMAAAAASEAAVYAAQALATATTRIPHAHEDPTKRAAFEQHLASLLERVEAAPWPMTCPDRPQLLAVRSAVAVAWDRLASDPRTTHTIGALIPAHDRALRLGLGWAEPVQRALAERITDATEAEIRLLLGFA